MRRRLFPLLALAAGCTAQPPRDRGAPPLPRASAPLSPPRARAPVSPPATDANAPPPARAGLAAGGAHTCLLRKGEVRCWGKNDAGQLGNGTRAEAALPAVVKGLTNPVRIALGNEHSCAL